MVSTLAQLGGGQASVSLIGVLGADATGAAYRSFLSSKGVSPAGLVTTQSPAASAVSLSMVTPDGERTMRTLPGAAAELSEGHVLSGVAPTLLRQAQLLHAEGYSLRRSGALLAAVRAASAGGAVVSLDLGCADVVRECHAALRAVLSTGAVDLVFANEAEAAALGQLEGAPPTAAAGSGSGGEAAGATLQLSAVDAGVAFLLKHVAAVSVTRGAAGSVTTRKDGERFATPACAVPTVLDTTGAGDAHAAGFLWALLHGAPLPVCAAAAAAAAAEAVQVRGAALPPYAVARLRDATAGAGVASAAAATSGAPSGGLLQSLSAWLWPQEVATVAHPAHRSATEAGLKRVETAGQKSTGHLWGSEVDYAQEQDQGAAPSGALVESFDQQGHRVLMRRTLSGRLLPAEHPGSFSAPYTDGRLHRSLSSRVLGPGSSGDLIAASMPSCGPAPEKGAGIGAYVAYFLGFGWLSAWVDSQRLFAQPEEAPSRMRRSMSSRVMSGRSIN